MSRAVPEWIAKHDDQAIPPRVRLRVFDHYEGRCYLSNKKIMPGDKWDIEHKVALCNGGEHREANLAPALKAPHSIKTKADRREKASVDGRRKSHLGIRARKGRPMPGSRGSKWKKTFTNRWVLRDG